MRSDKEAERLEREVDRVAAEAVLSAGSLGDLGAQFVIELMSRLVGMHVAASMIISSEHSNTTEEKVAGMVEGLGQAKFDVADAVAMGFERAMNTQAGKEVTYIVEITMVDDGENPKFAG
jgi:hypothetical protein